MGSLVRNGLWLGSLDDACKTVQLRNQGITHILTVEFRPLSAHFQKGFTYKYVHAEDSPDQDLISQFEECFAFIDAAISGRDVVDGAFVGGVFVHCYVGYSRSATIVIAYLMKKEHLSFVDALESVKKSRTVGPNPGFANQLQLFENMGCSVDKRHPEFRSFCLENITGRIRELSTMRKEPFNDDELSGEGGLDNALVADPLRSPTSGASPRAATASADDDLVLKCRKCRRPLAKGSSIVGHDHGGGKPYPGTPPPRKGNFEFGQPENAAVKCILSTFIDPVEWMKDQILTLEGRLCCPKCQAKVGTFNWVGQSCPCGRWIVPAFHLAQNKIDKDRPVSWSTPSASVVPTTTTTLPKTTTTTTTLGETSGLIDSTPGYHPSGEPSKLSTASSAAND